MPRVIKINHIGLAVEKMEDALAFYSSGLGLPLGGTDDVANDNVTVGFLPVGESRLELLEPEGESGPVQKFIENRGQGVHHICLEVEDLPGMLAHLQAQGVELLDNVPRPGAHNT